MAEELRRLLNQLPAFNRDLWCEINIFLHEVSLQAETNKMSPTNLGIVWGPSVFWDDQVITCWLNHAHHHHHQHHHHHHHILIVALPICVFVRQKLPDLAMNEVVANMIRLCPSIFPVNLPSLPRSSLELMKMGMAEA